MLNLDKKQKKSILPKGWKENVDAIRKDALSPKEKRILREATEKANRMFKQISDAIKDE